MGSADAAVELDALIVGAGFGGVYQLKKLRDEGFKVKLVESGSSFGGVWYWNRYPGARVDSPIPFYEFSDQELWQGWSWKQRFPGSAEIRSYFHYVADRWDLERDCLFNCTVTSATWNAAESRWIIKTHNGLSFKTQFFLPNTGFAAKRYIPDFKGIDSFQGVWVHPSYWPKEEPDLRGKKVGVIGTGATGIQLTQIIAPLASKFVLFQRTPNLVLPMGQIEFADSEHQAYPRDQYAALYEGRKDSYGGWDYSFLPKGTFDDNEATRQKTYEQLWESGDFKYWLATYKDMLFNDRANTEAYNFWRKKVLTRITDPRLQEKFAPAVKPHAFGCKRISLETGFYEVFNNPNAQLVDLNDTPIIEVTTKGIKTTQEEFEFDYVICATGYDAVTGGLLDMNVTGIDGLSLAHKWKSGVKTYLGLCVSGFPNMVFTYGPQAPTAFCNGPTCAEFQGNWIVQVMKSMRDQGKEVINALKANEEAWADGVLSIANRSLLPSAKSWYMGDNILGKTREPLFYLGGVPTYYKAINDCAANNYEGFEIGSGF